MGSDLTLEHFGIQRNSLSTKCPGPVATTQAQIFTPSPPWWTVGMRFVLLCCVWFHAWCVLWPNITTLVSPVKDIVPEVLWFVRVQLCKLKLCCHVVYSETKLSAGNPSKQTILVQSFSKLTFMNFNIDFFSEHCTV